MTKMTTIIGLLLISLTASAGSSTVECSNKTKSIVFSVGNGSNTVQIKYIDPKNNSGGVYDVPAQLMPEFDYNTEQTEKTINIIPVGNSKFISKNHNVQKVYNKDGSLKCTGREFWDDTYQQKMVLTGKDNLSLKMFNLLDDKKIEGMNNEGYITADFVCHSFGATTAGGCYPSDGD